MKLLKRTLLMIVVMTVYFNIIAAKHVEAVTLGFADVVLDFFDSGAGPIPGPYGGTWNGTTGTFPVPVSLDVVIDDDPGFPPAFADFLSLPTGSFVTLGFTDETVVDGPGDDIFITEVGASGESADVFVSADLVSFTFLGTIFDDITTALDLASIGFTQPVQGLKIVGLDTFGGSPGFDVINVKVLPGSIGPPPEPIPIPSTMLLLGTGLVGLAGVGASRKWKKKAVYKS